MLKVFILIALALLAVYFLFPEATEKIVSEVTGSSTAPAETDDAPGREMLPSGTTELELSLLDAVKKGDEARARELLSRGANVNGRDTGGETPLIVAASSGHVGHLGLMRFLLDEGASVDGRDSRGRTALLLACARGRAPEAAILLKAGADPDLASKSGNFPLLEAARFGDPELVRSLLSARAEVNQRASNGWTALKAAQERGHGDVAELLRNAGGTE